ncbi:MAG TPA: pentapeptide repeat-containing protein [Pseudomonadota bacterium]|jgi:uncharacterized protein YjbI with pentapeptide repeats|nr:pentapeptide repeat-containing protein [Pseudomonadota bacterium]
MADVVESKEQVLIRYRDKELRGCTIKRLWLQGISLIGADLTDVTFEDCSLDEANFTGATFVRTKFNRTSARCTNMTSATLTRAVFSDCNLTELCLEKALVEGVEFGRCDMDNLRADRAYLGNCSLFPNRAYGIKLRGATVIKMKVSVENGAPEMIRAQFTDATVIESEFASTNLLRADLRRALLVRCNLHRALLRDATIEQTTLVGCDTLGAELPTSLVGGSALNQPLA